MLFLSKLFSRAIHRKTGWCFWLSTLFLSAAATAAEPGNPPSQIAPVSQSAVQTASSVSSAGAKQFIEFIGQLESLTANFTQTVYAEAGVVVQQLQGTLSLKRPEQFRWQTQDPFPQLIVSDGETLWIYDEDLEQATIQPVQDQLQTTPAALLSGKVADLTEAFSVTVKQPDAQTQAYHFKARNPNQTLPEFTLFTDGLNFSRLTLLDALGQKTEITFDGVQRNQALSASQFTFTPPPGTDVIHDD